MSILIKQGVKWRRASDEIRHARSEIAGIFETFGEETVITSGEEGTHLPHSHHYRSSAKGDEPDNYNAEDYRGPMFHPENFQAIVDTIGLHLDDTYDVVADKNKGRFGLIHVEYDPEKP